MINVLELDDFFGVPVALEVFCSFSVSACGESFAVGLQLFNESSNADLVVSCNTSLNSVSNFAHFRTLCDFTVSRNEISRQCFLHN